MWSVIWTFSPPRCQLQSPHSPRRRIVTYAFQRFWVQKPTSNIHCKTGKTAAQPHDHCLVHLSLCDVKIMIKPRAGLDWLVCWFSFRTGYWLSRSLCLPRWALWFFKNDKSKTWQANLRLISKFDTVEDFWAWVHRCVFNNNKKKKDNKKPQTPGQTCYPCDPCVLRLYNHIQLSSNLMSGCDYSLFKVGLLLYGLFYFYNYKWSHCQLDMM